MIQHVYGNIINTNAELLVNAANGKGWMGGVIGRFFLLKGVAETIHYADPTIEKLAKKEVKRLKPKSGDVFHTPSGNIGFKKGILHAVTMNKPATRSTIRIVEMCIHNILRYCVQNDIKSVAIPLLGTGTGKVDSKEVLRLYESVFSTSETCFYVVHLNNNEYERAEKCL